MNEGLIQETNRLEFKKAYMAYNRDGKCFVPYEGNLTKLKEAEILTKVRGAGFMDGRTVKNVKITNLINGCASFFHSTGGGYGKVTIINQ